jgi:tRNA-uridine 2-sulfurtransferase
MTRRLLYNELVFERVFVAMSGGVDSSVTAHLLKEAGYNVSGIHMELFPDLKSSREIDHADLERTCQLLGIPLYYLHFEPEFQSCVVDYFCEEYSRGRTPNPCIRCNKYIKFGLLLDKVTGMGGDLVATGHYARVIREKTGYRLLKGIDPDKDQSYFLYMLGQKELARVLFPLGEKLKTEVKQLAAELGLPAVTRKESQDICFIPDKDSHAFIASHVTSRPGDIVDVEGRIFGRHRGLSYYTIGQRQGLGLSSRERFYVIGIEIDANRLIIGPQPQLYKKKIVAHDLVWVSGKAPEGIMEISAKVRYSSPAAKANLQVRDGKAEISFFALQRAIAPGQSVVFYNGDTLIGGGIIVETE